MPQVHSSAKFAVHPPKLLAQLFTSHRPTRDHRSHSDNLVEGVAPHLTDVVVPGFNEARNGRQADKGNAARVGIARLRSDEGGLVVDHVAMGRRHSHAAPILHFVPGSPILQQSRIDRLPTREKAARGHSHCEDRIVHTHIVEIGVERVEAEELAEVAA